MSNDQSTREDMIQAAAEAGQQDIVENLLKNAPLVSRGEGGTTASIYERECEHSKSCICYWCQQPKPANQMTRLKGEPHCPSCLEEVSS